MLKINDEIVVIIVRVAINNNALYFTDYNKALIFMYNAYSYAAEIFKMLKVLQVAISGMCILKCKMQNVQNMISFTACLTAVFNISIPSYIIHLLACYGFTH